MAHPQGRIRSSETRGGSASGRRCRQVSEIGDDQVWLMWGFPKWAFATVDEGRVHAVCLGADTIEGMVGDEEDGGAVEPDPLLGPGIGFPVRFEGAGLGNGNNVVECEDDVKPGS